MSNKDKYLNNLSSKEVEELCTRYKLSIMEYSNLEERIQNIIAGSQDVKLPFTPLEIIKKILEKNGFELIEADTNGYQVDFWYTFGKDTISFILEGSLWYGHFKLIKK